MRNANIYSTLLDVLCPPEGETGLLFGTLAAVDPLTVRVGETEVREGLLYPRGSVFYREQIGRELAMLPCEAGLLILFEVEGGETE